MAPPTEQSLPASAIEITDTLLRDLSLPRPDEHGDKEERGRLLVVGGSPEMPGPVILAATAALRAGAGKVQIATCFSIALSVASTFLEGRVFAMPETAAGGIRSDAAEVIIERARQADALLVGPGMIDEESTASLVNQILSALKNVPIVLDAGALTAWSAVLLASAPTRDNVILTPHAEEMASLLQCKPEQITRDPVGAVQSAVKKFKVNVLLKGAETLLALPDGRLYYHRGGSVGLATGGSGDTLAGLMGGLMARGASPAQAVIWAVYVHARAGERLARRIGPLGFLARELPPEFPGLLRELESAHTL
jgi:hydroxyethylthiazole kinase-like uncharacterized protein yjeF